MSKPNIFAVFNEVVQVDFSKLLAEASFGVVVSSVSDRHLPCKTVALGLISSFSSSLDQTFNLGPVSI